ncbi:MAG: pilus assembly protein [Blautia sp.]|nr:pilus assembly protein [Blautia sp.]
MKRKLRRIGRILKKGSLSVEAACVVPFVIMILMVMIYLCFYIHNRSWLCSAACEAALCGSLEAGSGTGHVRERAQERAEELGNTGFFGASDIAVKVRCQSSVQVAYQLDTKSMLGYGDSLSVSGSSQIIRPEERLRRQKRGKGETHESGI